VNEVASATGWRDVQEIDKSGISHSEGFCVGMQMSVGL